MNYIKKFFQKLIKPKQKCDHLISLNKTCGMQASLGEIIVWVGCENCGRIIKVKGDEEYIEKMNRIMNSY